jgi:penicillin amidase
VFEYLIVELARAVAARGAPGSVDWALGRGATPLVPRSMFEFRWAGTLARLVREEPDWLPPWPELIGEALDATGARVTAEHGPPGPGWAWGTVRPFRLAHPVGARAPFERVFDLTLPGEGDAGAVAQGEVRNDDPTGPPGFIPALRMVLDVGDWDRGRWSLPAGQSGNPCSPHYDDQHERWRTGAGVPIPWSDEAVAASTKATLRLTPSR